MAVLYPRYPLNVPAVAVQARAIGLSIAGRTGELMFREGEYWQWQLKRLDGSIVGTSPVFSSKEIPEIYSFGPIQKRFGYTVVLTYWNYPGTPGYYYQGSSKFPFYFEKDGKKRNDNQTMYLLYIKPSLDGLGLQGARHTARIRAERSNKSRRIREWTPASGRRNNEVTTMSTPKWNYNNGTGTQGVDTYVNYTRTRGGTITPNYLKRKKANTLPINAYSMSTEFTYDGGRVTDAWSDNNPSCSTSGGAYQLQWGSSAYGSAPSGLLAVSTSLENRAIKKLQGKTGPSSNIAQDLWQVSQLTRMIGDTTTRLAASMRSLKKGDLPQAISSLWHTSTPRFNKRHPPNPANSLADNWLALQYGWKPLLSDIHGLMDSIARLQLASVVVYTARSSAHYDEQKVNYMTLGTPGSPRIGAQITTSTVDVRYGIRYQIDNHLKAFLAQTGFTNPINLAWEVLPYSFVVDWFIPIGPYLESLTAWDGLVFLDGWKSTLRRTHTIWNVAYSGKQYLLDPNDHQMISYIGNCARVTTEYARVKLTAFPGLSIPSFKNPVSGQHAANGLALLNAAFRK